MNKLAFYQGYIYSYEKSTMVEKLAQYENGMPLPSNAPYIDNSVNDLALGKNFEVPVIRPVELWDKSDIPKSSTLDLIQTQAPVLGYENTAMILDGIDQASVKRSGMLSTRDVFNGFTRAGVGYVAGKTAANIVGTVFSLPPSMKSKLAQYGAIGAAFLNSGVAKPLTNRIKSFI